MVTWSFDLREKLSKYKLTHCHEVSGETANSGIFFTVCSESGVNPPLIISAFSIEQVTRDHVILSLQDSIKIRQMATHLIGSDISIHKFNGRDSNSTNVLILKSGIVDGFMGFVVKIEHNGFFDKQTIHYIQEREIANFPKNALTFESDSELGYITSTTSDSSNNILLSACYFD